MKGINIWGGKAIKETTEDVVKSLEVDIEKRVLDTHRGSITFFIPRLRNAKFQSVLADPYFRYDPYLLKKIVPLRTDGMSLEAIAGQTEWILGKRIPRSTLSQRFIFQYDSHLDAWNLRSLRNQYSALQADATYLKIRGGKGKKIAIFFRNLRDAAEEDSFPPEVLFERLRKEVLESPDHEMAYAVGMRICEDYKAIALKTVKILRKGLLEITIHLRHDLTHRKSNRSTNVLENTNGNLKRITNKARCYPDDRAAYRISTLFCLRYHQKRQERTDQKIA